MRLLLTQICTVFSLAAFSQNISPNNKVLIENFPKANTYSIQLQYSNGETTPLGSSKVYIAALFPQLDKLKVVKDNGDIVVTVVVRKEIDIVAIRQMPEYAKMLANYNRIEPLPVSSPSDKITYFQPLTISFQSNGSDFYSLASMGKILSRNVDRNRSTINQDSKEKMDALSSLEFLRANIFKLHGNQ